MMLTLLLFFLSAGEPPALEPTKIALATAT
jgi:hypothetical protein